MGYWVGDAGGGPQLHVKRRVGAEGAEERGEQRQRRALCVRIKGSCVGWEKPNWRCDRSYYVYSHAQSGVGLRGQGRSPTRHTSALARSRFFPLGAGP